MTVAELRKALEQYAANAKVVILLDGHYDVLDTVPSLVAPGYEVGLVVGRDERETNP